MSENGDDKPNTPSLPPKLPRSSSFKDRPDSGKRKLPPLPKRAREKSEPEISTEELEELSMSALVEIPDVGQLDGKSRKKIDLGDFDLDNLDDVEIDEGPGDTLKDLSPARVLPDDDADAEDDATRVDRDRPLNLSLPGSASSSPPSLPSRSKSSSKSSRFKLGLLGETSLPPKRTSPPPTPQASETEPLIRLGAPKAKTSTTVDTFADLELDEDLHRDLLRLDEELDALPSGVSRQACRIHLNAARLLEEHGHAEHVLERLRQARQRDPRSLTAIRELRRLARMDGRWDAVLNLYDAELDLTQDTLRRVELLEERGRIVRYRKNLDAGLTALNEALQLSPRHPSVLEAILGIHVQAERWNDVIETLTTLADVTRDPQRQVACLVLAAELAEHNLGLADEAADRYVAALKLAPSHAVAFAGAERLLIGRDRWGELYSLTVEFAQATDDPELCFALWLQAGRIAAERLERKAAAIQCFNAATALRPTDALPLRMLVELHRNNQDWTELSTAYEQLLEHAHPSERVTLILEYADVLFHHLDAPEQALELLLILLEEHPDHRVAHARILPLLLDHGRLKELVELQWASAERTTHTPDQLNRFMALGRICERFPKVRASARECYRRVLSIQPAHHEAFLALESMYRQEGEFALLAELYASCVQAAREPARQASMYWELAILRENHLRDAAGAIEALGQYRALKPEDLHAIWALQRLHRVENMFAPLVDDLDAELQLTHDALRCAALLHRKGQTLEIHLDQADDALEAYAESIRKHNAYVESHRARCALLRHHGRHAELAHALTAQLTVVPAAEQAALHIELATLHTHHLGERHKAIEAYEKALQLIPDDLEAFEGLAHIHRSAKNWGALRDVYERQVALDLPARRRAGLLLHIGALLTERFDQPIQAEKVLKDALELVPNFTPASLLLERIYGAGARWETLAQRLSFAVVDETNPRTRSELAHHYASLLAWRLNELEQALKPLEIGIDSTPDSSDLLLARELVARRLEQPHLVVQQLLALANRTQATDDAVAFLKEALSTQVHELDENPASTARAVLKHAPLDLGAIEHLEAVVDSPPLRMDLWQRRLQRAEGDEAVELRMALAHLLKGTNDVPGLLKDILDLESDHLPAIRFSLDHAVAESKHDVACALYEREAEILHHPEQKVEALRAGAILARDELGQLPRARKMLTAALELEPGNSDTYDQLHKLLEIQKQWRPLAEALRTHIDALPPEARTPRLMSLAVIWRDHVGEPERAISTLHELLELTPHHTTALAALAQLEENSAHWQEAVSAYRAALRTQQGELDQQRAWRLSLARILIEHLQQLSDAEPVLLEQLDLDPNDRDALLLLARLYERLKRWTEASEALRKLADLLDPKPSAEVLVRLAIIADQQEWGHDAEGYLERATKLLLKDVGALTALLAWASETQGYAKLSDLLNDLLLKAPVSLHDSLIPVRLALSTILADKLDRREEAEKEARLAARTDAHSVDAQLLAARLQIRGADARKYAFAALEADPYCVDAFEIYAKTLADERLKDELGFAEQALEVLGAKGERSFHEADRLSRTKSRATQPLGRDGLIQFISHSDEPDWARHLLHVAGHKAQIFDIQNVPSVPCPDSYDYVRDSVREICELFGLEEFDVYVTRSSGISVIHDPDHPKRVIIGQRALSGTEGERRFHIGVACAHTLSGTTLFQVLDDRDFLRLLQGLLGLGNSEFGDEEAVKQLSRFLPRRTRKAVQQYVKGLNAGDLHLELNTWRAAATMTACRAGLLAAGDVRDAAAGILRNNGRGSLLDQPASEQVHALQRFPESGDILRFSVSAQFNSARKYMGLKM